MPILLSLIALSEFRCIVSIILRFSRLSSRVAVCVHSHALGQDCIFPQCWSTIHWINQPVWINENAWLDSSVWNEWRLEALRHMNLQMRKNFHNAFVYLFWQTQHIYACTFQGQQQDFPKVSFVFEMNLRLQQKNQWYLSLFQQGDRCRSGLSDTQSWFHSCLSCSYTLGHLGVFFCHLCASSLGLITPFSVVMSGMGPLWMRPKSHIRDSNEPKDGPPLGYEWLSPKNLILSCYWDWKQSLASTFWSACISMETETVVHAVGENSQLHVYYWKGLREEMAKYSPQVGSDSSPTRQDECAFYPHQKIQHSEIFLWRLKMFKLQT